MEIRLRQYETLLEPIVQVTFDSEENQFTIRIDDFENSAFWLEIKLKKSDFIKAIAESKSVESDVGEQLSACSFCNVAGGKLWCGDKTATCQDLFCFNCAKKNQNINNLIIMDDGTHEITLIDETIITCNIGHLVPYNF